MFLPFQITSNQFLAKLLCLTIPMGTIPRRRLTGDAPATTGHDAHHASQGAPVGSQLLVVAVPGDQQIQPQASVKGPVPATVMAAWEVGHHDLPIGFGTGQLALLSEGWNLLLAPVL